MESLISISDNWCDTIWFSLGWYFHDKTMLDFVGLSRSEFSENQQFFYE